MMNNLEEELRRRLDELKKKRMLARFALSAGLEQSSLARFIGTKKRQPETEKSKPQKIGIDTVSKLLDALGATVVFPDQQEIDGSLSFDPPGLSQSPENADLSTAKARIARLEQKLDEKDQQIMELIKYMQRREEVAEMGIKKIETSVQAQQHSSAPPSCTEKGPELRELLGPGVHDPPEHDDSVRDGK